MSLLVITYVAFVVFVAAGARKAMKYARLPMHLRWELYPVAHEKERKYGGSYFEELNWWTKPLKRSRLGELKFMAREILLLLECYRRKRKLWYFAYPFHMGLFLLVGWLILLIIAALMMLAGLPVTESANVWARIIFYLILVTGVAGFAGACSGCVGLLIRRWRDRELNSYTAPINYFNLLFILSVLVSGLFAWFVSDPTFSSAITFVKGLITVTPLLDMNVAQVVNIVLFALLLIYTPFSNRLMHGLAKYFTYHRVRWDDRPNLKGSDIERGVEKLLSQSISWSAPHTRRGKTWLEVIKDTSKTGAK